MAHLSHDERLHENETLLVESDDKLFPQLVRGVASSKFNRELICDDALIWLENLNTG